jgi:hypothetical protein
MRGPARIVFEAEIDLAQINSALPAGIGFGAAAGIR